MLERRKNTRNGPASIEDAALKNIQLDPLVTVIVPFDQEDTYLPIMLHQLREQNHSDFEVICVNDGASNDVADVADKFASVDSRFKVIKNAGSGAGAARNTAIKQARGKYVICFGANDMISSDILERMIVPLNRNKEVDVVICNIDAYYEKRKVFKKAPWVIDDSKIPERTPFKASKIDNFYGSVCGYPFNKMIRKSLYDKYKLKWQETPMHNDMSLTQTALSLAKKVVFLNKDFYHFRIGIGDPEVALMRRDAAYVDLLEALLGIKEGLAKHKVWKTYKAPYCNYALNQSKWKYYDVGEDTRKKVHEKLRDEWFQKLGLLDIPKEEFDSEEDYEWMRAVIDSPELVPLPEIEEDVAAT